MQKQFWILTIPLIITVALTGCSGLMPGAEAEAHSDAQPLDPAAWPTPRPSEVYASPTPFPKITLAPTVTPTPRPAADDEATSTSVVARELNFTGDVSELTQQVTYLSGGFPPVAAAIVTTADSAIHQQPDAASELLGKPSPGEMIAVLGQDESGNWLYVLTRSLLQGWLSADTVRTTFVVGETPVLPPNPVPSEDSTRASSISDLLASFEPVAVALVTADSVTLRQGPSASYPSTNVVEQGELMGVLGTNANGSWLYVITITVMQGWLPADSVRITGSLDDAPVLPDNPMAALLLKTDLPTTAENGDSAQLVTGATQAEQASASDLSIPLELSSVATARANRADVDLYRGPAATYQPIVALTIDEPVSVLALNQEQDWALVSPTDMHKGPGWVPLSDLSVDGSLDKAPQVVTAWVESNELALRRGPGIYYEQNGTVALGDLVVVSGLNERRNWALVKPVTGGGQGWIPLNFVTLSGSWDAVPQAPSPPADVPSEQEAPAVEQTTTVHPGKLVFQLSSGADIMVIDPDGTGLRRLTSGIDPALSPDGQTVAFTRWSGEVGSLWLINVDGSNERQVLGEIKKAKHPAWSPDGQHVVVNYQHGGRLEPKRKCESLLELGGERPDIPWNVDPDSVEVELIMGVPHLCWTLPPDPHWGLRVVNLADGSFEDVPSDDYAFGPEWDPVNPWRIVSSEIDGLVQLDLNRSVQWALTQQLEDHTPAFSPDGRYIAVAWRNNGQYDIHRLNSDGSGRVALTETPLWVTAGPGEQKAWNNVSPAWSPDGSQIAFLTDRGGEWEVWVMSADGSGQRPMFPDGTNDQLQFSYDFVDERMLSWR